MSRDLGHLPLSVWTVEVDGTGAFRMGDQSTWSSFAPGQEHETWSDLPVELLASHNYSTDPARAWVQSYGVVPPGSSVQVLVAAGTGDGLRPDAEEWSAIPSLLLGGRLWVAEYEPTWSWLRVRVSGEAHDLFRPLRGRRA